MMVRLVRMMKRMMKRMMVRRRMVRMMELRMMSRVRLNITVCCRALWRQRVERFSVGPALLLLVFKGCSSEFLNLLVTTVSS